MTTKEFEARLVLLGFTLANDYLLAKWWKFNNATIRVSGPNDATSEAPYQLFMSDFSEEIDFTDAEAALEIILNCVNNKGKTL